MTGDDDLRARLGAIDPQRAGRDPGGAFASPTASETEIKERVMETIDQTGGTPESRTRSKRGQPRLLAAAAAVVLVAAVGVGGWWVTADDDPQVSVRPDAPAPLALSVGPGDAMTSCLPFDVAVLADMPVAFAATATAAQGDSVTLHVDRWYAGGSAETVTIDVPAGQTSAALDGVDFVQGEQYLLTATDGTVNGCGFSGPSTPELEKAFKEAFPG